jgi:hypothetical protein
MHSIRFVAVAAVLAACGASQTPANPPTGGGASSPLGGPCKADADCQQGMFCATDDPGGQCEKKCASAADCGAGAVCSDEKKCYRACQSDADCGRKGYACLGKGPDKFCDAASEGAGHEEHH